MDEPTDWKLRTVEFDFSDELGVRSRGSAGVDGVGEALRLANWLVRFGGCGDGMSLGVSVSRRISKLQFGIRLTSLLVVTIVDAI